MAIFIVNRNNGARIDYTSSRVATAIPQGNFLQQAFQNAARVPGFGDAIGEYGSGKVSSGLNTTQDLFYRFHNQQNPNLQMCLPNAHNYNRSNAGAYMFNPTAFTIANTNSGLPGGGTAQLGVFPSFNGTNVNGISQYAMIILPNYFEIIALGGNVWVQGQLRNALVAGAANPVMRQVVFMILHEIWAHIDYRKSGKNDDRRNPNPNNMGNPMENFGWGMGGVNDVRLLQAVQSIIT